MRWQQDLIAAAVVVAEARTAAGRRNSMARLRKLVAKAREEGRFADEELTQQEIELRFPGWTVDVDDNCGAWWPQATKGTVVLERPDVPCDDYDHAMAWIAKEIERWEARK